MLLRLAIVPIWIAGIWGSLQLYRLDLNLGHGICGAWGCGPPIEALLGIHGFWLALIIPATVCLGWYLHATANRRVGWALMVVGLLATIGWVGWDAVTYAMKVESTEFLVQRAFFTLVTSIDLPFMQTILAGGLLAFFFGRKRTVDNAADRTEASSPATPFAAT